MNWPMTTEDRIKLAAGMTCGLLAVIAFGLAALRTIGPSSPKRKLHGRYVLAWMAVGWTIAGVCEVAFPDSPTFRDDSPGHIGLACFAMLAGWAVGMIHGGIAVWWRIHRKNQPT